MSPDMTRLFHVSPLGLAEEIAAAGLSATYQLEESIECGQPAGIYGFTEIYDAASWALNGDIALRDGADLWVFETPTEGLLPDRLLEGSYYLPADACPVKALWVGPMPAREALGLGEWVDGDEWNERAEKALAYLEASLERITRAAAGT